MLARRFTIVCLLVTLFGMGLAILVADNSRPVRAQGAAFPFCDIGYQGGCPLRR